MEHPFKAKLEVREPTSEDFIRAFRVPPSESDSTPRSDPTRLLQSEIDALLSSVDFRDAPETEAPLSFFRRSKTLPVPRAGSTLSVPFPPPSSHDPPPSVSEPLVTDSSEIPSLQVIRSQPLGSDLECVPEIVLSFSHPMVPLAQLKSDAADCDAVPILTPAISGSWMWSCPTLLRFRPEKGIASGRLPKSTSFSVSVPRSLMRSVEGLSLAEDFEFGFSTVDLRILRIVPSRNSGLLLRRHWPLILIEFNQLCRVEEVLGFLRIREVPVGVRGDEEVESEEEEEEGEEVRTVEDRMKIVALSLDEVEGRLSMEDDETRPGSPRRPAHWRTLKKWLTRCRKKIERSSSSDSDLVDFVWITIASPLIPSLGNTKNVFYVELQQGCPSAEGPRVSSTTHSLPFQIYGPMRIKEFHPNASEQNVPWAPWTMHFTNQFDLRGVDIAKHVTIAPPVEKLAISIDRYHRDRVVIHGRTLGRTEYVVSFSEDLEDVFGQTIEDESREVRFQVGSAMQTLTGFWNDAVIVHDTMISGDDPKFSFVTCNLNQVRVCVFQVHPRDFHEKQFGSFHRCYNSTTSGASLEDITVGERVYDDVVSIENVVDVPVETTLYLRFHLQHPREILGHLFIYVEPIPEDWNDVRIWRSRPRLRTWLQVTRIALDCFAVVDNLYFHLTDLCTGRAIDPEGCEFVYQERLVQGDQPYKQQVIQVNEMGIGVVESPKADSFSLLYASQGHDCCFVGRFPHFRALETKPKTYIVNDRGIYKPNETVSIKGIIRNVRYDDFERILIVPKVGSLTWSAFDCRKKNFASGEVETNEFGSFFLQFAIPDTVNLGQCRVQLRGLGVSEDHRFKIQEFRTPEFTAAVSVPAGPYVLNEVAIVTGIAEYFSGGRMSGCDTKWEVSQVPARFRPPGSWKFRFGSDVRLNQFRYLRKPEEADASLEGCTNSEGEHSFCIELLDDEDVQEKTPMRITCTLNVCDITRQVMSASTSFVLHPSSLYVGVRGPSSDVALKVDEPVSVVVVAAMIDGTLVGGKEIILDLIRVSYSDIGSPHHEKVATIVCVSEAQPKEVLLHFSSAGSYQLHTSIKDDKGRLNWTRTRFSVGDEERPSRALSRIRRNAPRYGRVSLDREEYAVGEVAKISLQCPFPPPADTVIRVVCNGVAETRRFVMEEETVEFELPILKAFVPSVNVRASFTGMSDRIDEETGERNLSCPSQPACGSAMCSIKVPPTKLRLECELSHQSSWKPGEDSVVCVQLSTTDEDLSLADCRVSCIVVDEAVLSLTDYALKHPMETFFQTPYWYTTPLFFRDKIATKDWLRVKIREPPKPPDRSSLFMCKGSAPRSASASRKFRQVVEQRVVRPEDIVQVRADLNPLACFLHDGQVQASGRVEIPVSLPDSLTEYRVWVLATTGADRFGFGESSFRAQLPLALRPSFPRFLNFGDSCELCVVVQNLSHDAVVDVAARMTNLCLLDPSAQGFRVKIPESGRAEIRFPVTPLTCGTARVQIVASSSAHADAVETTFPVRMPATSEAFAMYGELDNEAMLKQLVMPPRNVFDHYGGLSVTTSSTALQSLTDAFLYLLHYEFDCVEQASSRILSICAMSKVLEDFNVPNLPSKAELTKIATDSISRIQRAQRSDGSFGFWSLRGDVSVYVSLFALHALLRASVEGMSVDSSTLEKGKTFLLGVPSYLKTYCFHYSRRAQASLRSFALYVLASYALHERLSPSETDVVVALGLELDGTQSDVLTHEGLAWLIFALSVCSLEKNEHPRVQKLLRLILNDVNETAETANFITSYGDDGKYVMLHSQRRTDAIILESLIQVDPTNSLIPKIVKGLLAHRKAGRWRSTQENVFVLTSLKRYFAVYEKLEPNFVARLWVGDEYCGEVGFAGRETESRMMQIPMKHLVSEESGIQAKELVLQKEGQGRLYYRLGLDYAPNNLFLDLLDRGFSVKRTYEAATDATHVTRDPETGTWTFSSAGLIRVKLTLANVSRRYHVALVDFLPAGCELMNLELKGGRALPAGVDDPDSRRTFSSRRRWHEHVNRRDERVEVFASLLYPGEHRFEYLMTATVLGNFVVPAAKAEEMYCPELFGRSCSERVIVRESAK